MLLFFYSWSDVEIVISNRNQGLQPNCEEVVLYHSFSGVSFMHACWRSSLLGQVGKRADYPTVGHQHPRAAAESESEVME